MCEKRFENQVVMITGAGGGIGRATAENFAKEGAILALTDVDERGLEDLVSSLKRQETLVTSYRMDVTKEEEIKQVVGAILKDFGKIDILVNNAGVSTMNWFWELTEEEWDFNMNVNAKGVWLVTKHVAPHMIQRKKGKIVNIASMAAKIGAPLLAHYSASKFAVVGFTQAAAKELAPYGINVNAVCPGFVKTPMQDREVVWEAKLRNIDDPEEVRNKYIAQTPLGRLCYPEDVARVVLFLASEDAGFMTGQAINVTGGVCMH
ncbi:MAG: meso-butanediol dehydrogenase / (S,S)-butanediol dehydrogenase / diacetyl reductase [Thermotogota bacterium]|nr:meso-butanediol dehydrogenase / (S,S)-butanediol dehydrogenase / diacetyl reductase [Thermotogota bacterium]